MSWSVEESSRPVETDKYIYDKDLANPGMGWPGALFCIAGIIMICTICEERERERTPYPEMEEYKGGRGRHMIDCKVFFCMPLYANVWQERSRVQGAPF